MPDERITIEIQAIDEASKEIDKLISKMELLNEKALQPYREMYEKGIKAGVPTKKLFELFPPEERLRIFLSLQRKYNQELQQMVDELSRLREGTKRYKRLEDRIKEVSRYQKQLNSLIKVHKERVEESGSRIQQMSDRLGRLSRRMNKVALQFVWGALSILGITWSMQMVVKGTVGVINKYVNALDNWANAAYNVALWMALAKREGVDAAKIAGGSQKKAVEDIVKTSLLLKGTLGSVKEAFMLFLAETLLKYPGLVKKLKDTAKELIDFFANPDNQKKFGQFLSGLLSGIQAGIRLLPQLIDLTDKLGNALAALSKPILSVLGIFVPGLRDVNKKLDKSKSGIEKLGVLIGALAALAPLLAPLMAVFQFMLSVLQGIVFFVSKLIEGLRWILSKAEDIGEVFGRIRGGLGGLMERLGGLGGSVITVGAGIVPQMAYTLYRHYFGTPQNVNVNQYINIGTVNKNADINEVTRQLYNPYSSGGIY